MELMFLLLLFMIASNTSPTLATNPKTGDFKEMVCSKCQEWFEDASDSSCDDVDSAGVYELNIPEVGAKNVFCDVADDGGKWTVFQRRKNGSVDFYRGWDDYVNGFGDLRGDHWLGLEAVHQMTKDGNMEMKIKMITKEGIYWVAQYNFFRIDAGYDNYRLHVSGFSGNATDDALSYDNNIQFTTKDADHDLWPDNCAHASNGAWWYRECGFCNLNGNFNKESDQGIWWEHYSNQLRFSEMKFREKA